MKPLITLILFFCLSCKAFGQYPLGNDVSNYHDTATWGKPKVKKPQPVNNYTSKTNNDYKPKHDSLIFNTRGLIVHFTPTNLIDPFSSPSFVGGIECKLYKGISLNMEGGGYFFSGWASQANVKGFIVKAEPKLNVSSLGDPTLGYISVEFMYKKQSFDWTDSVLLTPKYVKTFTEYRSVWAITLKVGRCDVIDRIVFDSYLGLGVRVKNVTSTLTSQEANNLNWNPQGDIDPSDTWGFMYQIGRYWYPNIEVGVRIGYCIIKGYNNSILK